MEMAGRQAENKKLTSLIPSPSLLLAAFCVTA